MPELPEVETVRRGLAHELTGALVLRFDVQDPRLMKPAAAAHAQTRLAGRRLDAFQRKGKYLEIVLDNGDRFFIHLRMTGQLLVTSAGSTAKTRFIMGFKNGKELHFVDQRRFGEIWLLGPQDPWPSRMPLGPDALDLSLDLFRSQLKLRRGPIQSVLLDQSVLAGVGNIYAQEALFRSGIRPSRKAFRLKSSEMTTLHNALQQILHAAIAARGSSSRNYRDVYGQEGSAQISHAVYRKTGHPCPRCKVRLRGLRIGGRGTVYCPACQS